MLNVNAYGKVNVNVILFYGNVNVVKHLMLMLMVMELLMWMLLSFYGKVKVIVIDNISDVMWWSIGSYCKINK